LSGDPLGSLADAHPVSQGAALALIPCSPLIRQLFAAEIAPCYDLRTRESQAILWTDDWYMVERPFEMRTFDI